MKRVLVSSDKCNSAKTGPLYGKVTLCFVVTLNLFASIRFAQALPFSFPTSTSFIRSSGSITTIKSNGTLCAKGTWYHNETQSCWPSKKQGPCVKSMIFYPIDKIYGDCDCPNPVVNHSTVWVYHEESNRCYKTYQQGYCGSNEWLVFNSTGDPACVKNTCPKKLEEKETSLENEILAVVLFGNKCVKLMEHTGDDLCPYPFEVIINPQTGLPMCSSDLTVYSVGSVGSFQCRKGTRRDRLGKCRPITSKVSFKTSTPSSA